MNILDYLTLDITDENNIKQIASFVFDELENLKQSDFNIDLAHTLKGVLSKFNELTNYYGSNITEEIDKTSQNLVEALIKSDGLIPRERRKNCFLFFEKIYSIVTTQYQQIIYNNSNWYLDFEVIFCPDKSNKQDALKLLSEVVRLIKEDNELPFKIKKSILTKLEDIIELLHGDKTNWTLYFGKVQQLIIVLGAIGSISGGIAAWATVKEAKSKLIESTQIIETTSVNQQFNFQLTENNTYYKSDNLYLSATPNRNHPSLPQLTGKEKPVEENKKN